MNTYREKLHHLIDLIPEDRLSYINVVLNQILRSDLPNDPKAEGERATFTGEGITPIISEDIFSDQDV